MRKQFKGSLSARLIKIELFLPCHCSWIFYLPPHLHNRHDISHTWVIKIILYEWLQKISSVKAQNFKWSCIQCKDLLYKIPNTVQNKICMIRCVERANMLTLFWWHSMKFFESISSHCLQFGVATSFHDYSFVLEKPEKKIINIPFPF